jgi:hypothetical protein
VCSRVIHDENRVLTRSKMSDTGMLSTEPV